jgi:hypothetical protein
MITYDSQCDLYLCRGGLFGVWHPQEEDTTTHLFVATIVRGQVILEVRGHEVLRRRTGE